MRKGYEKMREEGGRGRKAEIIVRLLEDRWENQMKYIWRDERRAKGGMGTKKRG